MNKSVFRTAGLVGVAVAMVASAASAWAQSGGSSSIPTPASSADSGSRAVVAITVPTVTDVQNIAIGAAQTVNQGGTTCGFLSLSGFDAVETSTACSGADLFSKPKAWASGSVVCPIGYVVMSWGPQYVKSTHTGGSSSTGSGDTVTSYRNKYHTCFKNG